jgi:hypothetical protein
LFCKVSFLYKSWMAEMNRVSLKFCFKAGLSVYFLTHIERSHLILRMEAKFTEENECCICFSVRKQNQVVEKFKLS